MYQREREREIGGGVGPTLKSREGGVARQGAVLTYLLSFVLDYGSQNLLLLGSAVALRVLLVHGVSP